MYYPESSHPAQTKLSVDKNMTGKQFRQSFYQKLLNYFIGIWEAENISPVVKTPEIYGFRFLLKY
jgi:hypothetical protein